MRQLDHDRRTCLMHGVGHFPNPRNDFILVGQEIVENGRAVFRHGGRARRHRQRHAASGPLDSIGAVAPFRHAVFGVGGFVGGDDDAVAQRQMFELIGLKKGIVRHVPAPKRLWNKAKRKCTYVSIKKTLVFVSSTRVYALPCRARTDLLRNCHGSDIERNRLAWIAGGLA
ncbi:hypothetical protein D3C80_536830 [compost metagenome]